MIEIKLFLHPCNTVPLLVSPSSFIKKATYKASLWLQTFSLNWITNKNIWRLSAACLWFVVDWCWFTSARFILLYPRTTKLLGGILLSLRLSVWDRDLPSIAWKILRRNASGSIVGLQRNVKDWEYKISTDAGSTNTLHNWHWSSTHTFYQVAVAAGVGRLE